MSSSSSSRPFSFVHVTPDIKPDAPKQGQRGKNGHTTDQDIEIFRLSATETTGTNEEYRLIYHDTLLGEGTFGVIKKGSSSSSSRSTTTRTAGESATVATPTSPNSTLKNCAVKCFFEPQLRKQKIDAPGGSGGLLQARKSKKPRTKLDLVYEEIAIMEKLHLHCSKNSMTNKNCENYNYFIRLHEPILLVKEKYLYMFLEPCCDKFGASLEENKWEEELDEDEVRKIAFENDWAQNRYLNSFVIPGLQRLIEVEEEKKHQKSKNFKTGGNSATATTGREQAGGQHYVGKIQRRRIVSETEALLQNDVTTSHGRTRTTTTSSSQEPGVEQVTSTTKPPPPATHHYYPETCARQLVFDLVSAVAYLHNLKIAHRDVKPQNFLIDNLGVGKLCDFGRAFEFTEPELHRNGGTTTTAPKSTTFSDSTTHLLQPGDSNSAAIIHPVDDVDSTAQQEQDDKFSVFTRDDQGTYEFFPPEAVDYEYKQKWSMKSQDVWAIGVTAYCFLFGKLPFFHFAPVPLFDQIKSQNWEIPAPGYRGRKERLRMQERRLTDKDFMVYDEDGDLVRPIVDPVRVYPEVSEQAKRFLRTLLVTEQNGRRGVDLMRLLKQDEWLICVEQGAAAAQGAADGIAGADAVRSCTTRTPVLEFFTTKWRELYVCEEVGVGQERSVRSSQVVQAVQPGTGARSCCF
ncbi:unnamed protein product [Amoebophrya sp. A120]|nr:unnamed protein product [Amoebophrya sp. A120]|eukprot:GSA120T00014480001.1